MSNAPLRTALVGCGAFANAALVPAMRLAGIDVVAVCDPDTSRAQDTMRAAGARSCHAEMSRMLGMEDVDAVVMAVGPTIYPKLAVEALSSGVSVFVEKPPAVTVADALSMKKAAISANRQLAVGFMKRFATGYRMAKEISSSDEFGPVKMINARITSGVWTPAWSKTLTPFSFVMDHSVHFLDLMRFFGGPVEWVCATRTEAGPDRFGFAVMLGYESGATGLLEISNFESRGVPNERIQITGADGTSVTVENVSRVTYTRDAEPMVPGRAFSTERERLVWEPNMTNISAENSSLVHMGYVGEMRNLSRALLGNQPISPSIDDGIAAIALAYGVVESDGKRINVSNGNEKSYVPSH
ncbi:Gfo/Idh/MocA family protein [Microvirga vignae]|nr:Gfo/Idh/MocA family oxidoreductase [Microvirga vignae]